MEAEQFVKLESVGSIMELKTGNIFPQQTNGKPDLDNPIHLSEISEEWLNSLKGIDKAYVGIWFKNYNWNK
jgi:hypothetical protein